MAVRACARVHNRSTCLVRLCMALQVHVHVVSWPPRLRTREEG